MPKGIPNKKLVDTPPLVEEEQAGGSPLVLLTRDGQDGWRLQAWDFEPGLLVEALRLALVDLVARGEGHAPVDVRFSGSTRIVRPALASTTPSPNGSSPASQTKAKSPRASKQPRSDDRPTDQTDEKLDILLEAAGW